MARFRFFVFIYLILDHVFKILTQKCTSGNNYWIWKILFEQIVDGEIDYEVERVISEAVNIWLPYLEINEIIVDYNDEYKDANKFGVEINFSLKSNRNLSESVTINVNN